MFRTATVQVNLDFADETDMVTKMRVGLALQPVATALFANSPFTVGKPNGFKSYRAEIWRDTDPDRTGNLPFAFEPGMGFERYVDYALQVPMYFVYRNGRYIDVAGASFKDFIAGRLERLPGEYPTFDDWADHLTTLFPDVGSSGSWKCAAQTQVPMLSSWRFRRSGSGSSTMQVRWPRLMPSSPIGPKANARPCATRFRASVSRRRFAAPLSAMWRGKPSPSPRGD